MDFTALERAVIEQILSRPMIGMDILKRQFAAASVSTREFTGVGFYTTISVPPSLQSVCETWDLESQLFSGACGVVESDPDAVISFQLWLDAGYLACLEGVTVRDHWPDEREIKVVPCFIQRSGKSSVRPTHFTNGHGGGDTEERGQALK